MILFFKDNYKDLKWDRDDMLAFRTCFGFGPWASPAKARRAKILTNLFPAHALLNYYWRQNEARAEDALKSRLRIPNTNITS
jgi:hypothetical protein